MVDVSLRDRKKPPALTAGDQRRLAENALRQAAGRRRALIFIVAGVLGLVVLGGLIKIAFDIYRDRPLLSELTSDLYPVHLTVGGESLTVPANMVRFGRTRTGGKVDQAELILHWPELEGYSENLAAAFGDGAPAAPIVYATIAARDSPLDSTARLDGVYARFFIGKPVAGPAGLAGRRLSVDSGYEGEIVYFVPSASQPFVARCLDSTTPDVPATCLRDINFGRNLSLLFRFDRQLLADWPLLDAGMRRLAASFIAR
jgi:hypothetical protein